jgi:hypothetical protein
MNPSGHSRDHIETEDPPASPAHFEVRLGHSRHTVLSRLVAIVAVAASAAAIGLLATEVSGPLPPPHRRRAPSPRPLPRSTPASRHSPPGRTQRSW